ncbi:group I truncated hemoglobin [Tumebacillus permanentifrigoris]|uniref:Group 1 truncated hemoglobin n=1 Tax=Tumebacillus permanentifrigoris TaxID=378543 RepID=A0A316DXB9_9BACL|nr:group 1 truncated hemoglobin [Tumebacillus permanentifrigoris]PWK14484.1 hemoglobin [Tumebacillus permanentifrigoris]
MSLYEKLGGEESISAVVENFYTRVLADDIVNKYFANTDMDKQRRHQSAFISFALGGPKQYSGKSMEKAHEGMNLQPEHFNAIATHLSAALADFNVPQEDIDAVINKIATLKDAVLYK